MWDNTDQQDDSAGYSDLITDFGFFVITTACCLALGGVVWMLLL